MTGKEYLLIIGLAALTLSACATTQPAMNAHSPTFGQAVAHNKSAQFVAPTPTQKADTFIPANRARKALARKNYQEDTVEKPEPLTTTR